MARDANVLPDGEAVRAMACGFNLASEANVNDVMAHAEAPGATITRRPVRVFWGGYSGHFGDPDGRLWEAAYHPVFPAT